MKNKKLILVILCLVLGLGIVGCSAKDISSKFVGSNNNDFEYIKENLFYEQVEFNDITKAQAYKKIYTL